MADNGKEATTLFGGALGVTSIVATVIATNGPLTGLIGVIPVTLIIGNGIGLPSVFVIVGMAYLLFSVGFTAMGRHVLNAGAFYAYVLTGIGRPAGVSAAFVAIVSYNAIQLACYGMLGYFLSSSIHQWFGATVSWWLCGIAALALIYLASIRNIRVSGNLLIALLTCELLVIGAFDIAALAHGGPAGYALTPFAAARIFTPGLGPAIVFVVGSYMGFETTAIYAEEAKDPKRTIPLATYISLVAIMAIYTVSTWTLIVAWGPDNVVGEAQRDGGTLWYRMANEIGGTLLSQAMSILMLTSLFAALLTFHNTTSRYIFALGRERILPGVLGSVSASQRTPAVASTLQALLILVGLAGFAKGGADPMATLLPYTATFASIGLLAVQCATSLAVVLFFKTQPHVETVWVRVIAPFASAASLCIFIALEVRHLDLLTGLDTVSVELIPYIILGVAAGGALYAFWLSKRRPERYKHLGRLLSEL